MRRVGGARGAVSVRELGRTPTSEVLAAQRRVRERCAVGSGALERVAAPLAAFNIDEAVGGGAGNVAAQRYTSGCWTLPRTTAGAPRL